MRAPAPTLQRLLSAWALVSVASAARAQPVLTLSSGAEQPGQSLSMTVVFKPAGAEIRTLTVRFTWPKELEFLKAKPGVAAQLAGIRLKPLTGRPSEFELAGDGPIPEGFVLSVDANIRSGVTAGGTVKIGFAATGTSAAGDKVEVRTEGGEVEIRSEPPPVIACFYYMH
jgi:hypothetical protein